MRNGSMVVGMLALIAVLIAVAGGIWALRTTPKPPGPVACAMDAKLCPDGSYVSRSGPKCEFAPCPVVSNCTSDSECPSNSSCQAIEGYGTAYPNNSKPPEYHITKGVCKLKAGNPCQTADQCLAGLVCHNGACTNPVGAVCKGPNDAACPSGYQCIQDCGPPVVRINEPPPGYHCVVNDVASKPRMCPI